jgi:selenoprotein W-related protein
LARAAWVAQELLQTFEHEIAGVTLMPGDGGIFEVRADGHTVWSRSEAGHFPQPKELKQRLRDIVSPDKNLGHADGQRG